MPQRGLNLLIAEHVRHYFDAHEGELPPAGLYQRMLATMEAPLLEEVMRATNHNQIKAAELLGINRNTLHKKLRQHGLLKARALPRRPRIRRPR